MRTKIWILGLIFLCFLILLAQDEWTIVYVKPNDNIFHLLGCKELEGFGRTGMTLGYAIEKGYKRCDNCLKNFDMIEYMKNKQAKKGTTLKEDLIFQRNEYIKNHQFLQKEIKKAISEGDILIGMDQEQVIASRGNPLRISKTTTKYGISEQWIMYDEPYSWDLKAKEYKYIYFENGKITSWQSR